MLDNSTKQPFLSANLLTSIQTRLIDSGKPKEQWKQLYNEIRWTLLHDNPYGTHQACLNICFDKLKDGSWISPKAMK